MFDKFSQFTDWLKGGTSYLGQIKSLYNLTDKLLDSDEVDNNAFIDEKKFVEINEKGEISSIKNLPLNESKTSADIEYKKSQKKYGKFANVLDVIFSSNVGKIFAIAGAIAAFFTPWGAIIGGIGLTISLSTLAYSTYAEVRNYQKLSNIKKDRAILEEIKATKSELDELLLKNPNVKELLSNTLLQQNLLQQNHLERYKVNMNKVALDVALVSAPSKLWSIGSSIASLNPISICFTVLSSIFGYVADVTQTGAYKSKVNQLVNYNQRMKEEIGLTDFKPGKSIEVNNELLGTLRAQLNAVKTFVGDEAIQAKLSSSRIPEVKDNLREEFVKIFNSEPVINVDIKSTTFKEAFKTILTDGFSANKFSNHYIPFRNDYYNECSSERFNETRNNILTKENVRTVDMNVNEEEIKKVTFASRINTDNKISPKAATKPRKLSEESSAIRGK